MNKKKIISKEARNLLDATPDHAKSLIEGDFSDAVGKVLDETFVGKSDNDLLSEIDKQIDMSMKANPEKIKTEITSLLEDRKDHIESFRDGKKLYDEIKQKKEKLKKYDVFLDTLKNQSREYGSVSAQNRARIEVIVKTQATLQTEIDEILWYQEPAVVEHYYRVRKMAYAKKNKDYVTFWSHEHVINEGLDAMFAWEHVLLSWPTGTGKTVLAVEIADRIQKKSWKPAYTLNAWGEREWVLSKSSITPEQREAHIATARQIVISGHSKMHSNEFTRSLSIEGEMKVVQELVGMLKAIHEWRPLIIDEIDTIPTETLMSIKALFNYKKGEKFLPQWWTWTELYEAAQAPMVIATMNGRSEKHKTRVQIDPAILRLFGTTIPVWYITDTEKYDFMLAQLMNDHGYIDSCSEDELNNVVTWVLPAFVSFIDDVEQRYLGTTPERATAPGTLPNTQKWMLSQKVLELGKLSTIIDKWKLHSSYTNLEGKTIRARISLTEFLKLEVLKRCTGPATIEDKAILLSVAARHGMVENNSETKKAILARIPWLTSKNLDDLFSMVMSLSILKTPEDDQITIIDAYQIGKLSLNHEYNDLPTLEHGLYTKEIQVYTRLASSMWSDVAIKNILIWLITDMKENKANKNYQIQEESKDALINAIRESGLWEELKQESFAELLKSNPDRWQRLTDKERGKLPAPTAEENSNPVLTQYPSLPESDPRYATIAKYRNDFPSQIKTKSENWEKTPAELVEIAQQINKSHFSLSTHAWLTIRSFTLPWANFHFATSDEIFDAKTPDPNNMLIENKYTNQTLAPWKKYLAKLKALKNADDTKWLDPIKEAVKQKKKDGVEFDHGWNLKKLTEAIQSQYNLCERDALAVFMYLTWCYGVYWTGTYEKDKYWDMKRAYAWIGEGSRWFDSRGVGNSRASLLFSREGWAPQAPEAIRMQVLEMQERWSSKVKNVVEWGTTFVEGNGTDAKCDKKECTDEKETKDELKKRCDLWIKKYVTHSQAPNWLTWVTTSITHPRRNAGNSKDFLEAHVDDYERYSWNSDDNNWSRNKYNSFGKKKLGITLRSIKWNAENPDMLPDKIDYNWSKEPNHTKKYLQWVKKVIPDYTFQSQDQMEELMRVMCEDIWINIADLWWDNHHGLIALGYILWIWWWYWNNDSGAYAYIGEGSRCFDSFGIFNHACLLFSRDG